MFINKTVVRCVVLVILFGNLRYTSCAEVGDSCRVTTTGGSGECKLLSNCPKAIDDLQKKSTYPQTCGFQGTAPIVCCEGEEQTITTSAPSITSRVPGQISKDKCKEYAKIIYSSYRPPVLSIHNETITNVHCTFAAIQLILGGEKAKEHEFPHMVLLGYDSPQGIRFDCGGTLISERFVLTAGHCLYSTTYGEAKYVRMGVTNINDTRYRKEYNIIEQIQHPEYIPPSHYNDIALLRLDKKVKFRPQLRPACLNTEEDIDVTGKTRKAIATGWGVTDFGADIKSDDLQKVVLEFVDQPACNTSYKNLLGRKLRKGILGDIQICAGSPDELKDTCQGDSGGPLQIYNKGDELYCTYGIVGVTSFGKPCGTTHSPGVYTRVSKYIKWIEDIVWP